MTNTKKIEEIVSKLTQIQLSSKMYLIPFGDFQREIIKYIPAKYRMIVYRRFMTEISNKIALKENSKGIVTGDNIGQVASQTLENLNCIYAKSNLPLFSPLIGFNKTEIIKLARQIGTYELSIKPYEDCCSFMISQHPVVKARLEEIEELEKNIRFNVSEIIKKAKTKAFQIS